MQWLSGYIFPSPPRGVNDNYAVRNPRSLTIPNQTNCIQFLPPVMVSSKLFWQSMFDFKLCISNKESRHYAVRRGILSFTARQAVEIRKASVSRACFIPANAAAVNLVKAAGGCDVWETVVPQQSLSPSCGSASESSEGHLLCSSQQHLTLAELSRAARGSEFHIIIV